ncbi:MAG TPA: hypothetical protein V6D20_22035 [Candidatus Obscuribacterales bacterium]
MSHQRVSQDPQQPPVRQPSGIAQAGIGNDINAARHRHPRRLRFQLNTAILRNRPHQPLAATRPPNHAELSSTLGRSAPVPPEDPPILDIQAADRALHLDSPTLGARNHSVYPNMYTQREFFHYQAPVPPHQHPITYLALDGDTRPWWTAAPEIHPSHASLRNRFAYRHAHEVPNYTVANSGPNNRPTIADIRSDYVPLDQAATSLHTRSRNALNSLREDLPPFDTLAIPLLRDSLLLLQDSSAVDQLIVANRVAHLEQDVYRLRNINNDLLSTIHTFRANQDFQYLIIRELALQAGLSVPIQLLRVPNWNYFNDIRFQGNHELEESTRAIPTCADPRHAFQDIVPPNDSNPPPWPTQVHNHDHFYNGPTAYSCTRRHPDATTAFGKVPAQKRPPS